MTTNNPFHLTHEEAGRTVVINVSDTTMSVAYPQADDGTFHPMHVLDVRGEFLNGDKLHVILLRDDVIELAETITHLIDEHGFAEDADEPFD
jgi:hypothetical protein